LQRIAALLDGHSGRIADVRRGCAIAQSQCLKLSAMQPRNDAA
jgi:hypothetical protein